MLRAERQARQAPVSMKELLANRGVFIGCMIFLLQQFSGVNSVVYFSSSVFAKASTVFSSHGSTLTPSWKAMNESHAASIAIFCDSCFVRALDHKAEPLLHVT